MDEPQQATKPRTPRKPRAKPTRRNRVGDDGEIFTTGQVATLCRVAPRTVSKWVDRGFLKGARLPGSQDRRIYRSDLVRFAAEHGLRLVGFPAGRVVGVGLPAGPAWDGVLPALSAGAAIAGAARGEVSGILFGPGYGLTESVGSAAAVRAACPWVGLAVLLPDGATQGGLPPDAAFDRVFGSSATSFGVGLWAAEIDQRAAT